MKRFPVFYFHGIVHKRCRYVGARVFQTLSNGVRQGSILSPHLFAVYLDGLLIDLSESGVGCHWGCSFAGAFGYADDIVLLAPCAVLPLLIFTYPEYIEQISQYCNQKISRDIPSTDT